MSQSGSLYFSSASQLEYLASSASSPLSSLTSRHTSRQYSITDSLLESAASVFFQSTPSYNLSLHTASPVLYGSAQYAVSPSFFPTGYNRGKEYACFQQAHVEYHFVPDNFIRPGKGGVFIGKAEQIRPFVEEAFEKIIGWTFPTDINISILNEQEFRLIAPHPGIIGLSLNRTGFGGVSEIFVLNDSLARVMLTVGHELGHVLTETLSPPQDEEAKAYAFSFAWMKTVQEQNIANLGAAIVLENPAQNGLHNVAFHFVQKMLDLGKSAWNTYLEIIRKNISVKSILY